MATTTSETQDFCEAHGFKCEHPRCMECGRVYTEQNPEAVIDVGSPESGPRIEFTACCAECYAQGDEEPESYCPVHGQQSVVHHSVTQGPDPYDVDHLACGHAVVSFGPANSDTFIVG